jgi:hypothetical protein
MMLEVKSFKDMDGKTVKVGDKIRYVSPRSDKENEKVRTVKRITKQGYFISVFVEEMPHAWHQPSTCVRKVEQGVIR